MESGLLRLFLPVGAGVLLGLFVAFRGLFRACREAPDGPGFARLLAGLAAVSPVTKLFYAAILAFVASQPLHGASAPVIPKETVFLVAGNVMGLAAFAQGLVAAARMRKMTSSKPEETARAVLGPTGRPGAIPVTLMIQGFFETPAIFAMIGGMLAVAVAN